MRFKLGFTLLAVWLFGLIAVAAYFLATLQPGKALITLALTWVSMEWAPRVVLRLVMIGAYR